MAEAERSSVGSVQFSGGEKEVIERKLDVSTYALDTRKDISDFYGISRCVDVIKSRGFEKVITSLRQALDFGFCQTFTRVSLTDINKEKIYTMSFRKHCKKKRNIIRLF